MNLMKIISFIFRYLPDKPYLYILFYCFLRYRLNLSNPRTFNEKLNWLKLYDRKDYYTNLVDKYEVKKHISNTIWEDYIIPTLWIFENFNDIDFSKLPKEFVIKCTHNSWWVIVVKDKNKLDIDFAKKTISKLLKTNYFYPARERPYKNVKPRIIVEKYVKDDIIDDLRDYKFMCFNWQPKYVYITVKNDDIFENWYDMDFNKVDILHGYRNSKIDFDKPELFEEMKDIAEKLSKGFPFIRIDLHYVNKKILFWEMTFYDWAWIWRFTPFERDKKLWNLIELPKK